MAGKKLKENEKAVAARQRKEEVKEQARIAANIAAEDAKWADEGSTTKEKRARERAEKEQQKAALAARKKALQEEEERQVNQMKLNSKAKQELRRLGELPQKVTQFALSQLKEEEEKHKQDRQHAEELKLQKILTFDPLSFENTNRLEGEMRVADEAQYGTGNVLHARGVESAIKALSLSSVTGADLVKDRRPEKRVKAAYKQFESERLPELRADFPELKLSQLKERLRKEWDKSERNPLNAAEE